MTESENEGLDPRVAAMIAERQKEEDAIALDSQAAPSEEAIDPRIQAIIEERQKEEPDVELTPEQLKAAEDALIPAPPTAWDTLGENLIDKGKNASPVDAMAITGGALTGYKLPGVVNRVTPVMSGENEEKLTSVKDALKNPRATLNQDIANDLEIQHGARVLDLQDQRYMAERDLEEAAKNLKKAQLSHANVKAINIDELLGNKPTAATPAVTELTRVPIGGVAAQNYDISHGGTEAESLKAPSTSKVQKDIPGRTEAWNKIAEIAPEYERTKESPLLLNPNEQKYKLEQLNQQSKQEAQQEGLKKKMQEDLAKRQAKAQKKLEDAQKAHDESLKAIRKIEADLESHKSSRPVSAEQKRKARIFSVAKHTERERNFSDQDIVDALARVAQELGVDNLSRFVYDKHRSKEDPSTALITSRLSSWNNAVESAGLKSFKRGREYTSRWTDQEVIQWISKFLNESSGNGGIGAYELWSKQYKKEAPSASSIRVRKPGMAWSDWKTAALKDMGV